jgi:hypothetical protein
MKSSLETHAAQLIGDCAWGDRLRIAAGQSIGRRLHNLPKLREIGFAAEYGFRARAPFDKRSGARPGTTLHMIGTSETLN